MPWRRAACWLGRLDKNMLYHRLRQLERAGYLKKLAVKGCPPTAFYALAIKGCENAPIKGGENAPIKSPKNAPHHISIPFQGKSTIRAEDLPALGKALAAAMRRAVDEG